MLREISCDTWVSRTHSVCDRLMALITWGIRPRSLRRCRPRQGRAVHHRPLSHQVGRFAASCSTRRDRGFTSVA